MGKFVAEKSSWDEKKKKTDFTKCFNQMPV